MNTGSKTSSLFTLYFVNKHTKESTALQFFPFFAKLNPAQNKVSNRFAKINPTLNKLKQKTHYHEFFFSSDKMCTSILV